jgi:extracellular elastinolytic metalloproteinase
MTRLRRLVLALALLAASSAARAVVAPPAPEDGGPLPDWDVRGTEAMATPAAPTPAQRAALDDLERLTGASDLVVRWGPQPGTLHHLFRRDGWLSDHDARDAETVARAFLLRHRALLGLGEADVKDLVLVRRIADPVTDGAHLLFEQRVDGVEVFGGDVRVNLDRLGRVLSVAGNTAPVAILAREVLITGARALQLAARAVRVDLAKEPLAVRVDERGRTFFPVAPFESEPWIDPTWFPHDAGLVRAWRAIVDPADDQGWYQVVVDARTGDVLSRVDLVDNVATGGLVFREDPGQGPQVSLPFIDDLSRVDPASPLGWTTSALTEGHACDVKDDIANDNEATAGRRAAGTGTDPIRFDFPFQDDPARDLDASLTNLFYLNSWLHDRLWRLGFDEPAGNFQVDNFGRGGRGGDRVLVDAQDGGGRNNANFGTPPDGFPPRMQMYVWTFTNPNRDSGLDASVVTHELFHGVSNRLVGGADNAGCLGGDQDGAMGEAWSDFFACSFWNQVTVGGYLVNNYVRGIRRAPYDAYPFDYGQLCNQGGFEVHRDGEIWAATLWDVRTLFVERYGYQEGRCKVERLVLDGMKLSPCRPTFVDMRDAILLAARLSGAGGDACLLWQGFAGRGLGTGAVSRPRCTTAADASFEVPPECAACAALERPALVGVDTTEPNAVAVSFTPAASASEHVLLRAATTCPAQCLDAEFVEVARGDGAATVLVDRDSDTNRLSVGETFAYRVAAMSGTHCTSYTECAEATVTGRCTLNPVAAGPVRLGVLALERPPATTCAMTVSWTEAAPSCGPAGAVRYNVYRAEDPAFVPGPEHLVASLLAPATSYVDAAVPPRAVTYVVRAEDLTGGGPGPHGGNEEPNLVRLTLAPQGLASGTSTWLDDAEAGELPGYTRTGSFAPNDWAVVADGNTRGGAAWHVTDVEGGNADKNLELPPLSLGAAPRLQLLHAYQFEDCYDGGVLEISTDAGRTWRDLIADTVAGGYATSRSGCGGRTQTVGELISPPNTDQLFTGENASGFPAYDAVEVDLLAYAGTLDARLRLRCLVDPLAAEPGGWYVDDLTVEDVVTFDACTDTCTAPPMAVLLDVTACASAAVPTLVALDASGSTPGAPGWAADLPLVLTHDGPGSFGGRRWAPGPAAVLTFPAGTPAGDYSVTLTARGADTCAVAAVATVTLVPEVLPPAGVGATLRVAKDLSGLLLTWGDVGATAYNVHAVRPDSDLTRIHESNPAGTATINELSLTSPEAQPGGGTLFLAAFAASSCGRSVP